VKERLLHGVGMRLVDYAIGPSENDEIEEARAAPQERGTIALFLPPNRRGRG